MDPVILTLDRKLLSHAVLSSNFGPSSDVLHPLPILTITLLGNHLGWLFQWPSTGDVVYRIVLQGRQIATVQDTGFGTVSYIYDGSGFIEYPPPLEIMPLSQDLAQTEINPPFLVLQWYGNAGVSYYQVQEFIAGIWQVLFQTMESGDTVYSWTTPLLVDGTTHQYQVVCYNEINQASSGLAFDASPIVTPFNLVETSYTVSYTSDNIVFNLK